MIALLLATLLAHATDESPADETATSTDQAAEVGGVAATSGPPAAIVDIRTKPKPERPPAADLAVDGEWRLIGSSLSKFPVNIDGDSVSGQWLDHRLRTGTSGRIHPVVDAGLELDLAVGTLVGDDTLLEYTPDERRRYSGSALSVGALKVRRLSATTVAGDTQIELGLVTSQWGLGMVANSGSTDPLFGRSDFGDRVLRFRATHIPTSDGPPPRTTWLTTGAVDLVVADELANLNTDQQAVQAIVSVLGLGRRGSKVGAYFVARNQWEDREDRSTQAMVLDGYADAWHTLGPEIRVRTAFEIAGIAGRTNRATTYNSRDRIGVLALGATGVLTLEAREGLIQLHLLTGYASGDGDPDDGTSHDFTFDRDFGVGMVLFDEVMAGIEAASWIQVNDPEIAGQGPDGSELLVNEGAFRRAVFAQPAIQVQPNDWLDLRAGVAVSASTAFYAHPFTSTRGGGVPTNHLEQPVTTRFLGSELDWSVGVMRPTSEEFPDRPRYGFTAQGGHMGVSQALDGPGMPSSVHLVTGTARLLW